MFSGRALSSDKFTAIRRTTMSHNIFHPAKPQGKRSGLSVRILMPRGIYPHTTIAVPGGVYIANGDLVFSIVDATPWDSWGQDSPYTEMDWLMPEEIRFLSSIFLCQTFDSPPLRMYPQRNPCFLADDRFDIASDADLTTIKEALLNGEDQYPMFKNTSVWKKVCKHISTFRRSFEYDLTNLDDFELDRQKAIFAGIDIQDHVLLRGLATLMKSAMLTAYSEFYEEATMVLFVSLDASLSLVLKRLRARGPAEPTVKDAADWVYNTFDKPLGHSKQDEVYFAEFYEKRVMTLHPESRYGTNAFAPLFHDDQIYLFNWLVALYAYLITGDHSCEYRARLQLQTNR